MNHKAYLALALPLIFSTITTPLLGAVDTAVVGQLPDPSDKTFENDRNNPLESSLL
jgi:Na+-driven multidrug efflux pump